jgi:site-specific DNA-methyltransferase (adenine-specific)
MYELYLGDCLEYMKSMPDKSVDAVITDPPYSMTSGGLTMSGLNGSLNKQWGYDNKGDLFDVVEFGKWFPGCYRVLIYGGELYTMTNDKNLSKMQISGEQVGLKLHNIIVWDKGLKIVNRWYMKQCEFILYFWKGEAKTINNPSQSQLISLGAGNVGKKQHPSEKPAELMSIFIENSTSIGDTIFDPFMGSGTTGVAAIQLGRNFIGCEIDPTYYAIAEKRIKEATLQPQLFPSHVINSTQEKLIE